MFAAFFRFNEGKLTKAMENIHRAVDDPQQKKVLREGDGMGTSATRASIIADLIRREFLTVKGKALVSTDLGRRVITALPESLKSPTLTALFERTLKNIEANEGLLDAFVQQQADFVRQQVAKANNGSITLDSATPPRKPAKKRKSLKPKPTTQKR
ncbi:MAG: DNA topoisomerase [Pseudohongiellaceae bacterium]